MTFELYEQLWRIMEGMEEDTLRSGVETAH
jgi:hypothetical protein